MESNGTFAFTCFNSEDPPLVCVRVCLSMCSHVLLHVPASTSVYDRLAGIKRVIITVAAVFVAHRLLFPILCF